MPILDIRIAQSSDDAIQTGVGMNTAATTTSHSFDAVNEWGGFRYQNIPIEPGSTILEAWLRLRVTSNAQDEPLVTLYGHDIDDSPTFTAANNDISNRTPTTATVAWDVLDLGSGTNTAFNTPDISDIIQEIIDRPGWASGNALSIIMQGGNDASRDLTILMFDGGFGAEFAPILHVVYQRPGETTLILEPGAGGDDGYRFTTASFNNSSNDIDFGKATISGTARIYRGFCRFPNATIPSGATIEGAKLRFIAAATDSNACVTDYYFNDVDDATAPTTAAQVDALALTTATVQQTHDNWQSDNPYHSADLTAPLQEVIDRAGWASGQDLMALIWGDPSTDNGSGTLFLRRAATFERTVGQPQLVVDYSVAAGTTPIGTTRDVIFDVRGLSGSDWQIIYDTRESTGTQRDIVYGLRSIIGTSRGIAYNVLSLVATLRTLIYDVREAVGVERSILYALRSGVGVTQDVIYSIRSQAGTIRIVTYNVRSLVGATRDVLYDVRARVGTLRSIIYDIESQAIVVGIQRAISYSVRANVGVAIQAVFATRSLVGASRDIALSIRAIAGTARDIIYGVRTKAGTSRAIRFSTRIFAGTTRLIRWTVESLAHGVRSYARVRDDTATNARVRDDTVTRAKVR